MNWFLILFPLSLVAANIALYLRHHKKIGLKERVQDSTYTLSPLTRLFSRAKYFVYLVAVTHIIVSPLFLNQEPPGFFRIAVGMSIGLASILLLYASLRALGENYAPCDTGRLPAKLVKSGPYRFLSHPIYLSNLMLYLSLATLSFSYIIVGLLLALGCVYFFAIRDENRALRTHFS